MKKLIVTLGFVFALTCILSAQNSTPVVSQRQLNQKARIVDGVKDGEITKREARVLRHQQRNVQKTKHQAKADGVVTRAERKQITQQQNKASRTIKRAKNNSADRN